MPWRSRESRSLLLILRQWFNKRSVYVSGKWDGQQHAQSTIAGTCIGPAALLSHPTAPYTPSLGSATLAHTDGNDACQRVCQLPPPLRSEVLLAEVGAQQAHALPGWQRRGRGYCWTGGWASKW